MTILGGWYPPAVAKRAHPPRNAPPALQVPKGTSRLEWQAFLALGGRPSTPDEWERCLASENMPADVGKVPDPAGPHALKLPCEVTGSDPDDDEHPLRRWPRRASPSDPAIGPALASSYQAWAARAFELRGFFRGKYRGGRRKNPQRGEIWRLTQLEGRHYREVAAITGRSTNAVRLVVQQVRRRLTKAIGPP